jgi:hypothetical protein
MKDNPSPKIFISYSWSSDEHIAWVASLGERLMSDGIDVILDQWSLEDGHDVNAFMEKMVSDPSIKRVVSVSDSVYASKANARKGGVGTETQIISEEVYDLVDQNKFIPILKERDEKGVEFLPIYLKSRKYIDFSDTDQEADAYDQLVRNIFERPKRRKPVLGKPPAHLFDELANSVSSAQKAKRFREIVTSGKGAPALAFDELFLRAETRDGFQPLATMLGMRSQKELIESLESECISRMFRSGAFFLADVSLNPFNYSALKRMWGGK